MTTHADLPSASRANRSPASRAVERVIALYGAAVFTILWVGFALGSMAGGAIFADAWTWLTGLETLPAVVAWILALPIAIGLWALESEVSPLVMTAVVIGLIVWTLVAASGVVRAFRRA